jgi:hypothetical protein
MINELHSFSVLGPGISPLIVTEKMFSNKKQDKLIIINLKQ